jgi:hypothetical protein
MLTLVAGSIILPEIILRSAVSISSNLITSVNYLKSISKYDEELQTIIEYNDIVEDINIIKNYIQEKEHCKNGPTVETCIKNLTNTLVDLEKNIKIITEKIESHEHLWFRYFRSYNIGEEKKKIPLLIKQLKHRFDLLIQVSLSL